MLVRLPSLNANHTGGGGGSGGDQNACLVEMRAMHAVRYGYGQRGRPASKRLREPSQRNINTCANVRRVPSACNIFSAYIIRVTTRCAPNTWRAHPKCNPERFNVVYYYCILSIYWSSAVIKSPVCLCDLGIHTVFAIMWCMYMYVWMYDTPTVVHICAQRTNECEEEEMEKSACARFKRRLIVKFT